MPGRDIIVIGASAGGVEALSTVIGGLPADLPAAVFAVLHVSPHSTSVLPSILQRAGRLPAAHARDGEPIRPGRVYVAPPDRHLLVRGPNVHLARGPRENGYRPAVDTLFRSAAVAYGPRVVGVVLSGALDDGTAGLRSIKVRGGVAVAQHPNEATFPGMPMSAVQNVAVDHVLPLREIPPLLARLATEPVPPSAGADAGPVPREMQVEDDIASMDPGALTADHRPGHVSGYSCPECNGSLFEIRDGQVVRFRCRVGHAYSIETLVSEQAEQVEAALWSATVALKEKALLARRMTDYMHRQGHTLAAERFEEQAKEAEQRAQVLQDLLERTATAEPLPAADVPEGATAGDGDGDGDGNGEGQDETSAPATTDNGRRGGSTP